MEYEEAKTKIVEGLTKKSKMKSKFYFNDLAKILEMKPRAAKKFINQLVQEEDPEQVLWLHGRFLSLILIQLNLI